MEKPGVDREKPAAKRQRRVKTMVTHKDQSSPTRDPVDLTLDDSDDEIETVYHSVAPHGGREPSMISAIPKCAAMRKDTDETESNSTLSSLAGSGKQESLYEKLQQERARRKRAEQKQKSAEKKLSDETKRAHLIQLELDETKESLAKKAARIEEARDVLFTVVGPGIFSVLPEDDECCL